MLDAGRGGFWQLHSRGAKSSTRAYLPGTNVLRTVFSTAAGDVAVTDLMPVGRELGAEVNQYVLRAPERAGLDRAPRRVPARLDRNEGGLPPLARVRA